MSTRALFAAFLLLGASALNAEPEHDYDSPASRLLEAILRDDLKEAARLIAAGTEPKLDPNGYCLALAPIAQNKPSTLRFLIEHGADANCQASKGLKQTTLLGMAVELDRVEISRLLLTLGADPNRGSLLNRSFTPFIDVIEQCRRADRATEPHLLLIKDMLKRGANINAIWHEGERSESVLNLAVRGCPSAVVEVLLSGGANPNALGSDAYGDQTSPLATAIYAKKHSMQKVELLLKAGADATTKEISTLASGRHVPKEIVNVLRAAGAQIGSSP